MTSNTSIDGTDVLSTGKSAIDEIVVLGLPVNIPSQGDTITGWSFSDNNDLDFNANLGLLSNQGFNIRAENESGNVRTLSYVSGAQNFAASATDWDNGQNDKFWSIRFKADGFSDMKISSKQFSDNANPGPKHWKIQTRKSGETWADLTGAENIIVSNNWTSGVVNNIPLPSSFDFPGTTSLFVRWIMTSNEAINGQSVLPTGISAIDDIIITGINSTGIESIIFKDNIAIYPNPTSDVIIIESTDEMQTIDIFDIRGRRVYSVNIDDSRIAIDISDFNNGIYVVNVIYRNSSKVTTRKIIKN